MTLIAEDGETQEQADFLWDHGCDQFQGFLFSYAVPNDPATREHNDLVDIESRGA